MRHILVFILLLCVSVYGYTKIEKLSTPQALKLLELMDKIEKTNDQTLKNTFTELTDLQYDPSIRTQLYDVVAKNQNHTSFFMKMVGLVSFQNVILVCMVMVAIAFIFSLAKDIVLLLGAYVALLFVRLLLNKKFMYTTGIILSSVAMYFKPDEIENVYLRYLFIFDWLTPLFGCMIFGILSFMIYDDLVRDNESKSNHNYPGRHHGGYDKHNSYIGVGFFVTCIFTIVALYHQNWLVGVLTVMMLFFTFGFLFGAMFGGYYTGFTDDNTTIRCLIVSLILNSFMIGLNNGFITGDIVGYTKVFDTGVFFWGSLVGSIAMLILSDEWYLIYRKQTDVGLFIIMQILMGIYCLTMMYFGNIMNIASYKSIGGTFLVLWGLDLEKTILKKIGTGHLTIALAIVLANLWYIKQLISWYPEYCIV
ncbi:hypothetical protein QKU48_gp0587 [Fadolivirus algeromassiliense]|jgi:hypothetical protein|uniref:Uncharacterized protein n=1 Tax=Fadolivirus FV1/VV64 TaxID=3070911 RepID=A0A7D3QUD1_9VIRU|nr:hypothetical protein QKU48_gp0587 [Fadolivirus algeromassiliense]QKF94045.1 hypothetical protein Fadolivirus_1_587 [Fadolivirus FV1/VV64]